MRSSHLLIALAAIIASFSSTNLSAETFALDDEGKLVNFERDIAPIFRTHCLECHQGDEAKADFRIDDRDNVLDYLEPEDAESSSIYADYLIAEDEDSLMPPRAHGGPLSAGDLSLVQVWINEGADWPDDFALVPLDPNAEPAIPAAVPTSLIARVWAAQGFLHPATVHFPIALLLFGGGFVVLGWKWPAIGTQIPLACLLIGALTSIVATAMGWSFSVERGYGSWDRFDAAMMDKEVFWHRWSAVIVTILATVFAIVALISLKKKSPRWTVAWKLGLLACAAMVGAVGHQGGEMSYGEDFYPKALRTLLGQSKEPVAELPDVTVETSVPES